MRETAGFPRIFNIESDPKEMTDIAASGTAWVLAMYSKIVGQYKATLKDYPNPPAPNLTKY
jgi:arylsulfatase